MPFTLKENAAKNGKKTASLVGCPEGPTSALKECLKTTSPEMLVMNYFNFFGYSILPMSPYAPVIENCDDPFLPEHPYLMLKENKIHDKPWVTSTTTNEGSIITGGKIC